MNRKKKLINFSVLWIFVQKIQEIKVYKIGNNLMVFLFVFYNELSGFFFIGHRCKENVRIFFSFAKFDHIKCYCIYKVYIQEESIKRANSHHCLMKQLNNLNKTTEMWTIFFVRSIKQSNFCLNLELLITFTLHFEIFVAVVMCVCVCELWKRIHLTTIWLIDYNSMHYNV